MIGHHYGILKFILLIFSLLNSKVSTSRPRENEDISSPSSNSESEKAFPPLNSIINASNVMISLSNSMQLDKFKRIIRETAMDQWNKWGLATLFQDPNQSKASISDHSLTRLEELEEPIVNLIPNHEASEQGIFTRFHSKRIFPFPSSPVSPSSHSSSHSHSPLSPSRNERKESRKKVKRTNRGKASFSLKKDTHDKESISKFLFKDMEIEQESTSELQLKREGETEGEGGIEKETEGEEIKNSTRYIRLADEDEIYDFQFLLPLSELKKNSKKIKRLYPSFSNSKFNTLKFSFNRIFDDIKRYDPTIWINEIYNQSTGQLINHAFWEFGLKSSLKRRLSLLFILLQKTLNSSYTSNLFEQIGYQIKTSKKLKEMLLIRDPKEFSKYLLRNVRFDMLPSPLQSLFLRKRYRFLNKPENYHLNSMILRHLAEGIKFGQSPANLKTILLACDTIQFWSYFFNTIKMTFSKSEIQFLALIFTKTISHEPRILVKMSRAFTQTFPKLKELFELGSSHHNPSMKKKQLEGKTRSKERDRDGDGDGDGDTQDKDELSSPKKLNYGEDAISAYYYPTTLKAKSLREKSSSPLSSSSFSSSASILEESLLDYKPLFDNIEFGGNLYFQPLRPYSQNIHDIHTSPIHLSESKKTLRFKLQETIKGKGKGKASEKEKGKETREETETIEKKSFSYIEMYLSNKRKVHLNILNSCDYEQFDSPSTIPFPSSPLSLSLSPPLLSSLRKESKYLYTVKRKNQRGGWITMEFTESSFNVERGDVILISLLSKEKYKMENLEEMPISPLLLSSQPLELESIPSQSSPPPLSLIQSLTQPLELELNLKKLESELMLPASVAVKRESRFDLHGKGKGKELPMKMSSSMSSLSSLDSDKREKMQKTKSLPLISSFLKGKPDDEYEQYKIDIGTGNELSLLSLPKSKKREGKKEKGEGRKEGRKEKIEKMEMEMEELVHGEALKDASQDRIIIIPEFIGDKDGMVTKIEETLELPRNVTDEFSIDELMFLSQPEYLLMVMIMADRRERSDLLLESYESISSTVAIGDIGNESGNENESESSKMILSKEKIQENEKRMKIIQEEDQTWHHLEKEDYDPVTVKTDKEG